MSEGDGNIISVENLGKRYRLFHRRENARYVALRDVLTEKAAGMARSLWPWRKKEADDSAASEDFWALKDVSFTVKRGEVVGIIGRNGAGKSTLLKVLSRITEPTTGRVEIDGRVASLLEVGTGFHPELTGRENIYLNGAILGMARAEIRRKFDEIVAFAEVERFLDTPVKHYSSGMYVRLAFGVAAHMEPEILVVDEVLAVGDLAFQKKCLGKMGDVASKEGRTVLFVSHNMAAIRKLCGRALLLQAGKVEMDGLLEPVVSRYLSANSAAAMASIELPAGDSNSPARALRLHLRNLRGEPQSEFRLGEGWTARVEFEVTERLEHVLAAVGLVTVDSVSVVTFWTKPKDLAPGRYEAEFEISLPLAACEMSFAVGLSTHERAVYYVEGVGRASVSEIALDAQPVRASGTGLLFSRQLVEIKPSREG